MLREEFLEELQRLRDIQQKRNYKKSWIWFCLKDQFDIFFYDELVCIKELLNYKSNWIKYKFNDQYCSEPVVKEIVEEVVQEEEKPKSTYQIIFDEFISISPITLQELKSRYRKFAKTLHPDVGGKNEDFHLLQNLYDAFVKKLEKYNFEKQNEI